METLQRFLKDRMFGLFPPRQDAHILFAHYQLCGTMSIIGNISGIHAWNEAYRYFLEKSGITASPPAHGELSLILNDLFRTTTQQDLVQLYLFNRIK